MKITTKLTTMILSIVVGTAVVISYFVYMSNVRMLEEEIRTKLEYRAEMIMSDIDRFMFERQTDIEALSMMMLFKLKTPGVKPSEIRKDLVDYRNANKNYVSLSFFDLNRVRVADTAGIDIGKQHQMGRYWEDILKGHVSTAEQVGKSGSLRLNVVYIISPVKKREGKIYGAIVARTPVPKLYEMTRLAAGTGREAPHIMIDLVNKDGLLLYSNHNRVGILKDRFMPCDIEKRILAGEESGSGICRENNNNLEVFANEKGYMSFTDNNWTIILTVPKNIIFAPAVELRNRLIAILSAVMIVSVIAVLFFSRLFTGPIIKLNEAARRLRAGEMDVRVEVESKDEIGQLSHAFNEMAAAIMQSRAELESYGKSLEILVEQRTSALRKTMEDLKESRDVMLSILEDTDEAKKRLEATLTELKNTQQQLIQSGKLSGIGQMAAGVAHEINNPLTSILGFSQLVLSNANTDPSIKNDLQVIEKEARRCITIIENLLNFARVTPPQTIELDLNNVIEATLKVVSYSLEREMVEVVKKLEKKLPKIMGDPYQFQQVFMNLIVNALHAMPSGGSLTIATGVTRDEGQGTKDESSIVHRPSFVVISFTDTGIGMTDEVKAKVFEPFFSTSYEKGLKGTGLGLSICYSIVQQHNGRIEFESEEGKGTTFRVILPAV